MRRLFYLFVIAFFVVAFTMVSSPEAQIRENIQGSWELISYVDHEANGEGWSEYPDKILYQKHITDNHFTWYKYNMESDRLLGMGGGSYEINEQGKYVENIEFFYPPGSSELGQSIPFTLEFKDGKWHHTGKAKKMELGEDGSMVMVGSIKIEEIWTPVIPASSNKHDLIGSWDLDKFREANDEPYMEYPIFTGYMKLVTPTHFVWIKYDREGDQIFAAGGGPYEYDGQEYHETLKMVYPSNSGQVETTVSFEPLINQHRWDHYGKAPVRTNGSVDSILIDEVWVPHVCDKDMEFSSTF